MPIQNGKYVAPTWTNNAPPAIDANELNAMSQSIQNNYPAITGTARAGEDLDFLDVVDINGGTATKTMAEKIDINYSGVGNSGQNSGSATPFYADYQLDLYVTKLSGLSDDTLHFSFINRDNGKEKFNSSFDISTISGASNYGDVCPGIPIKIASGVVAIPFTAFRTGHYNKFGIIILKYSSSSVTSTYGYFDVDDALDAYDSAYTYYFKSCYSKTNKAVITMIVRPSSTYGSYIFVTFINTSTYRVTNNIFLDATKTQFISGKGFIGFDLCMYDDTHCIAVGYSNSGGNFYSLILQEVTLTSSSASYGYNGTLYSGGTGMTSANVCLYKSKTNGNVYALFEIMKSSSSDSSALMFSKIVKSGSTYNSISSTSTEISSGTTISANLPVFDLNDVYYSCYSDSSKSAIIKIDTINGSCKILDISTYGGYNSHNFSYLNYVYQVDWQYSNRAPVLLYTIDLVNISKDAIAISNVSSGKNVNLLYGGIYKNDLIDVGTKIYSDGIIAESFEQGYLSVIPKTENNSYVTNITITSSTPDIIEIDCGFVPNFISIICTSYGGEGSYTKCYTVYKDFYITYESRNSGNPIIQDNVDFIIFSDNGFSILGGLLESSIYKICAYKY